MSLFESDTIKFLESHAIFQGVPPTDLAIIFPFLDYRTFEAGEAIIEESTVGHALYIVTDGAVEVTKEKLMSEGDAPRRVVLGVLRKGETFGEMEILDTFERSASVVAKEKTGTLVLAESSFHNIYECRPDAFKTIMLNIARDLSRRLRIANARLAELAGEE